MKKDGPEQNFLATGAKLKISPILRLSLAHFRILSLADILLVYQHIWIKFNRRKLYGRVYSKSFDNILPVRGMNMQHMSVFNTMLIMFLLSIYNPLQSIDYREPD